ncbi:MAG: alanine--tRNA ligase [Candidatus Staskawiczbacteria bacterium]|jgi:alanyl-tRNA synthetase
MNSFNVRQKFLDFFKSKDHAIIPSSSIIPVNDSSTLFIGSGMQPLVLYLLGEKHPLGTRLTDSQKSFRAEDIEEVGDGRHTTFFEMLGNWSLGDYFKKEQLPWIFSFLVDELKIDPSRLYVTVFRGDEKIGVKKDEDSVNIWKAILKERDLDNKDLDFAEEKGMGDARIFYYPGSKNWWSRSGSPEKMPVGEIGGPDSEIFYDLGADLKKHENSVFADQPCHVNCDCGRFIEIGNSVFMEYKKTEKGFEKLKQFNVDFGGGLERMTMVTEGLDNIFQTDLFVNVISKIEELSGKRYKDNIKAFEIVADHLKAVTFIIGDDSGISPSNVGQGYIARRLIRRAIRFGKLLGICKASWTKEIAKIIAKDYALVYPEIEKNLSFIAACLDAEEEKFVLALEKGLKECEIIWRKNTISGKDAFDLYQTCGFPIEMTEELAKEKGLEVDMEEFQKEFVKHKELSRTVSAGAFKGGLADASLETTKLHTAAHLMLAGLRKVLGDHVTQKGSNINAERLRFDFFHKEKMTPEQIKLVEDFVNKAIEANLPVNCEEMDLNQAHESGAMGVFESKYGDKVKVYTIGDYNETTSREICGGPHVETTGILGHFKIQKEESSSAGVRRIKAILE